MQLFVGIVPPADIGSKIIDIQLRFGDNRLEPHITLRPPVKPTDAAKWIEAVRMVAAQFYPFTVLLPVTGYFGKRVLFIKAKSKTLNSLHNQLLKELSAFEQTQQEEEKEFHPHLTLGRRWCGFSADDFRQMQQLIDEYIGEGISFLATSVRIYRKANDEKRYQPILDIPLD